MDKDYDSARFDETGLVSKGKGYLYRKFESATDPAGGTDAVPALENGISMARGGGEPLPRDLRHGMERALGADFSDVKIHHDKRADRLNRMVDARAFTTNQHVFFQKGAYNPGTSAGKRLIAHELTHVVQQNRGLVSRYHLDQSSTEGEASGTPLRSVKSEMQRAAGYLPATSYGQYGVGAAGGLPDPGGIVAGAAFTAGQKTAIYAQNNVWTAGGMWPVNNGPALGALPAPPPYHEELNDTNLWKQVNLQVGISQVDHIYPKNLGGLNSYKNAQILAAPDNNAKKNVYPWAKQAAVYSGTRVMVTTKSQNVPAGTILDVYGVKKAGVTAAAGNPVIKIPAPTPPSAAVLAVGLPKVAMTLAGFTYINYKTAKGFGLADPNNPPVP